MNNTSLTPPAPFRGRGKIRLIILGRDPTVQDREYRKKIKITLLALIVCFMVGCQDKAAMAELEKFNAQAALDEANKALFMRSQEAWFKEDIEVVKEFFSADFVGHGPLGEGSSLEQVFEGLKRQRIMFPDMTNINKDLFAKGTHTGDIEGFLAS